MDDVRIYLDGKPYVLRPGFEELSYIEQNLGVGLIVVAQKLSEGMLTLEETTIVIAECIAGHSISVEMVKKSLIGSGLAQALEALSWLFARVFEGGMAWEGGPCQQSAGITRNQLSELMCKFPDVTEEHIP